jgi:hypothetical protein
MLYFKKLEYKNIVGISLCVTGITKSWTQKELYKKKNTFSLLKKNSIPSHKHKTLTLLLSILLSYFSPFYVSLLIASFFFLFER